MRLVERAPAKLNLFLHVGPPGADGFHPLASLMAFADIADEVTLEAAETMALVVEGPFAADLGAGSDNLVARARDAYLAAAGVEDTAFRLTLTKNLPVASGIGGGSADAAATLRLLHAVVRPRLGDEALGKVAFSLGADVPACLGARPAFAQGRGERLSEPPVFPDLDAVLVNPGAPVPTPRVFARYDDAGDFGDDDLPAWPEAFERFEDVVEALRGTRNDLQAPAIALAPVIGEVLGLMDDIPAFALSRMSGSGATCFGLARTAELAFTAARRLSAEHPDWWVRPTVIRGSAP